MINRTHLMILGACLVSIGTMGSSFHEWAEVFRPNFIFGCIGVVGANIAAMYAKRPNEPK